MSPIGADVPPRCLHYSVHNKRFPLALLQSAVAPTGLCATRNTSRCPQQNTINTVGYLTRQLAPLMTVMPAPRAFCTRTCTDHSLSPREKRSGQVIFLLLPPYLEQLKTESGERGREGKNRAHPLNQIVGIHSASSPRLETLCKPVDAARSQRSGNPRTTHDVLDCLELQVFSPATALGCTPDG